MPFDSFLVFTSSGTCPKIVGETQDSFFSKHQAMEITEFSFGEENATTIGSATGGAGSGKAKFNPFKIKKLVDSASANLFLASASGAHFETVTLNLRKAGATAGQGSGGPYLIFSFKMVFITNVDWSGANDDDAPSEEITFAYGAMQISYSPQTKAGAMGTPVITAWSQVLNKNTFEVPG